MPMLLRKLLTAPHDTSNSSCKTTKWWLTHRQFSPAGRPHHPVRNSRCADGKKSAELSLFWHHAGSPHLPTCQQGNVAHAWRQGNSSALSVPRRLQPPAVDFFKD